MIVLRFKPVRFRVMEDIFTLRIWLTCLGFFPASLWARKRQKQCIKGLLDESLDDSIVAKSLASEAKLQSITFSFEFGGRTAYCDMVHELGRFSEGAFIFPLTAKIGK